MLERVSRLEASSSALWGRMTVGQMICHTTDPMRIALGEMEAKDASTVLTRTLLRWLVLAGVPAPKGKVKTFPELDQAQGRGTPPTEFANDIATLRSTIERFDARARSGSAFVASPGFGRLSNRAYGRLMYIHMNHHLNQFGV